MKMQKLFLTFLISGLCLTTYAQKSGNGQNEVEQRGRKTYGGPSHSNLRIPKSSENVNITDLEIYIDPANDGGINVTAKGLKSQGIKGCDCPTGNPCECKNLTGKLILTGNVGAQIESASDNANAKQRQSKNLASDRSIIFKSADGKQFKVVTNINGSFKLNSVPNGTYSIWVGGKEVILDYILTATTNVKDGNNKSGN